MSWVPRSVNSQEPWTSYELDPTHLSSGKNSVPFLGHDANGNIIQDGGYMAIGLLEKKIAAGEYLLKTGDVPVDRTKEYVDVNTKTRKAKTRCPARLTGHQLQNVPTPSEIAIDGKKYQHDTDPTVDLIFHFPGKRKIIVRSAPHLDGEFEVNS
jgi:hypothetical protein